MMELSVFVQEWSSQPPLFLENIHPLIACFGEDLFEGLFENYRQKVVSFWKIKQCQGLSTEKADHSAF